MKQGRADRNVQAGQKREPIATAKDVGAVSQLGEMLYTGPDSLNAGRGFNAPAPLSKTVHQSGSQGKYK